MKPVVREKTIKYSTECFVFLNCVLYIYISQLYALYFSTVRFIFIFLNCVLYISQQCAFYVSAVTQIRKAYRIFPIHFLFLHVKRIGFFSGVCLFWSVYFFIRNICCVYVAASRVYLLGMSILCYCYLPVIF